MNANTFACFQYRIALPNAGNTTVRVEQKVNGVYQYLTTQQTQTTSGIFELVFTPSNENIRVSVNGTSGFALQQISLDRDNVDTLVNKYLVSRGYRYGFQGQEKDDEVKGAGNSVNYTYRMHDPRLGRFFAIDPLAPSYPWNSPYAFSENNVIHAVELEGLEKFFAIDGSFIGAGNADDKRKMLVLNSETASSIKGMTNEARVDFLQTKPFDIVLAPNSQMIGMMEKIQEKGYKKEFGFAYGVDGDGNLVFSEIVQSTDNNMEIDLNVAINELNSRDGVRVLGVLHSHPTDYKVTETTTNGSPKSILPKSTPDPSGIDLLNQGKRMENGIVQQAGIIIGQSHDLVNDMLAPAPSYGSMPQKVKTTDKISFYGGNDRQIEQVDFKTLKNASKTIEKSKN